jgi:uncharacterized protein (DUF4415 family)
MERPAKLPPDIHWPTDEEEAEINRGIALDPSNPEITDQDWRRMRPALEVVPELVETRRRGRPGIGRPLIGNAPKVHIGFRLSADLVAGIRATGRGYNARVEKVLRAALVQGRL